VHVCHIFTPFIKRIFVAVMGFFSFLFNMLVVSHLPHSRLHKLVVSHLPHSRLHKLCKSPPGKTGL